MTTSKVLRLAYIGILLSLAGCADIASLLSTPTPAPIAQATATPQPVPGSSPTPLILVEARILRLWLPPRFDPQADSAAAILLAGRLAGFEAAHPGLKLDIRIKAEDGETGLPRSLSVTNVAAPSAMPDLVALRRADLESAASGGLLHPIDGLSTLLDDPNWYPYARDLGHLQNIGYGLPFAGDVLVLARPSELAFNTWEDILAGEELLLFPAGDPQALVPLSLYVSAGGRLVNEQGLPTFEEEPLLRALTLFQNGVATGVFTPSLLNLDTDEQSFQAYRDGRSRLAVTWATNLTQLVPQVMQPIPGLGESPHTFADGWSWALAGSTSENQQLATELAEFLMDDAFLGEWTREIGYLPTRIGDPAEPNRLIESAQILPSREVLTVLGPIMNQAVSRILNGEQVAAVVRSVLEEVP